MRPSARTSSGRTGPGPLLTSTRSEDDARSANELLKVWQPGLWAPLPLVLFGLGVAASLFRGWRPGLLLGACVALLIFASAALNGPQERYRYPVDPAIAVLMASGVVALGMAALARVGRRSATAHAAATTCRRGPCIRQ